MAGARALSAELGSTRGETQRQNIMIGMSMMSQQISSAFQNPSNFFKILYYGSAGYATYHVLRLVMMGMSKSVMGRFGKP